MLLFRWLLSPFSFVYYLVSSYRNLCFNKQWIKSHKIPIPSISIGNLSLGGTGKSPLTNYLIHLLKSEFSIYVLSRGYGRKTKGFKTVETNLNSAEVGDEPLAYKIEHGSDITVAVDETGISVDVPTWVAVTAQFPLVSRFKVDPVIEQIPVEVVE